MAPIAVASVMQVRGSRKKVETEKRKERGILKKKLLSSFRSLAHYHSLSIFPFCHLCLPLFLKKKQFMLAEATLRGKDGKRRGKARPPLPRAPATAAAAAAAAGTAAGAGAGAGAAAASPPRDSSAELVPLRRVQEQEGEEEEEEEGMAEKRRAARTSRLPPRLPASPFVSNGGDGNRTSSPPPPSSSPPRFRAARGDCVSIDMEPGGETAADENGHEDSPRRLLTRDCSKTFKARVKGLEAEEEEEEETTFPSSSSSSSSSSRRKRALSIVKEVAAAVANPPAVAALLGLAVGSVPALRSLLFAPSFPSASSPPSSSPEGGKGSFAVLGSLSTACETLGGAMIPALMVVLGAELASQQQRREQEGELEREREEDIALSSPPSPPSLPPKAVAAALSARLVLMPCFGACFLILCSRFGLLSPGESSPPEPLFRLVALLAWGEFAFLFFFFFTERFFLKLFFLFFGAPTAVKPERKKKNSRAFFSLPLFQFLISKQGRRRRSSSRRCARG